MAKGLAKSSLARFCMPAKNKHAYFSKFLGCKADRGSDVACFSVARRTACNAEYADRWRCVKQFMLLCLERKRQIPSDRDKAYVLRPGIRPAKPFRRHSKNSVVRKIKRIAHGVQLHGAAQAIDQAGATKWLGVVKYDSDTRASFAQHSQNVQKSVRKSACGPRQRRVLHIDPCATPGLRLEPQCFERRSPTAFIPWNSANFHRKIVSCESFAEIAAILFNGVGRFVAPSQQSDDASFAHFSTRKLPITSASRPELKKVLSASVGV